MSQYYETPCRTFQAGAAIAQYLRVKLSSGKLAAAGASERELGTIETESYADLDYCPVRLRTAPGTAKMVAAGAITAGATVYAAASGKVASTGGFPIGTALETVTADGDVVEVLRDDSTGFMPTAAVAATGSTQANGAALTAGALNVVSAADGTKAVVLPAAVAGTVVLVYSSTATAGLPVFPASGDDINDGTADAAVTIEGKTLAVFVAADAATWTAIYTANT